MQPSSSGSSSPPASPDPEMDRQKSDGTAKTPAHNPIVDYTQEVRFAIVMYGGVSLAIYMNGVAQELLRLVRATAPKLDAQGNPTTQPHLTDAQLKGSEKVYRQLGRMLVRGKDTLDREPAPTAPISTRFVIDILSGSSAGGINAVFLAKALANDQDMNQLREMWVKEGDITVLLNDKESDEGLDLGQQKPPRSLLNSRRMYYKLLDALYGMDKQQRQQDGTPTGQSNGDAAPVGRSKSPYADEIDLFTTATDNVGRVINLRLADGIARERRHLNKFHFRYRSKRADGEEPNDFIANNNPFLAFAARCTSAHQSSFEPMKLADIDEALEKHQGYKSRPTLRADNDDWKAFYQDYLRSPDALDGQDDPGLRTSLAQKFKTRPFSDGGALDNSPFTFAIEQLQLRQANLPVERKLIYVEPVPEHPEEALEAQRPPDAIENAWLALSVLPRYQFIREDLERLLEHNRLIERVNRIVDGVKRDEMIRLKNSRGDRGETEKAFTWDDFCKQNIDSMIRLRGSAWGGYHRLRVAEATDEIEKIISQATGFDPDSAESQSVRYLVRTWRSMNFDAYGVGRKGTLPDNSKSAAVIDPQSPNYTADGVDSKETENCFLYRYDLKWRVRRLRFVLQKIDELSCFDANLGLLLGLSEQMTSQEGSPEARLAQELSDLQEQGEDTGKKAEVEYEFRKELQSLKGDLNDVLREMVSAMRNLLPCSGSSQKDNLMGAQDELLEAFDRLKDIKRDELMAIARGQTDTARTTEAAGLLQMKKTDFDNFLRCLNAKFNAILCRAAIRIEGVDQTSVGKIGAHAATASNSTVKGILEEPLLQSTKFTPKFIARRALRYYYDNFDRYDMITYPLFYATSVGEERDMVDVYRISPEDATRLVSNPKQRRKKLAGTSLSNFGAFFDERFRVNDIFWGRLDCAERLIAALLPVSPEYKEIKNKLIDEAHREIIAEEFESADRAGISALLSTLMVKDQSQEQQEKFLEKFDQLLNSGLGNNDKLVGNNSNDIKELQKFVKFSLSKEPKDPLRFFADTYKFDHSLNPQTMVRAAGRASKVFGKMLEGIAETHRIDKSRLKWVTRLTQLFWSLVEVAVPGSISNLVFYHWLKLLYLFQFLLIFLGTLFISVPIQRFGILIFAVTVALHTATLVLGDAFRGKTKWWNRITSLFISAGVIVALIGFFFLFSFFSGGRMWEIIISTRAWYAEENIDLPRRMLYAAPIIITGLFSLRFALRDKTTSATDKTEEGA